MNYLKQILAFHDWLETNRLDPTEQALWFHLMDINNKCGWPEWFRVANMTLQARLGVDRKTLDRKRNTLMQKGRMIYKNQGKREAGTYHIMPFVITGNIPVETTLKDGITGNIPLETGLSVPKDGLDLSTLYKLNETKGKEKILYAEIINHLNNATDAKYKHTTKATKEHIQARWNEGWRLPDFQAVIDKKAREWKGTNMAMYLRPETLFGTKFEGYLNQPEGGQPNGQARGTPNANSPKPPGKYAAAIAGAGLPDVP